MCKHIFLTILKFILQLFIKETIDRPIPQIFMAVPLVYGSGR